VFPAGPILLANALKIPVVLFFGLYKGGNRYEEHFELFADEIHLSRASRPAELQAWVTQYAARLEHYCRLAPYNWFNFFDFWGSPPEESVPPQVRSPA
jgi:predicted LPLAT superfamily acyltransferase